MEKNSPMLCVGVSASPFLWRGRNCLFAIPGEVSYKISVFGLKAKMKPAKYPMACLGDSRFQEILLSCYFLNNDTKKTARLSSLAGF